MTNNILSQLANLTRMNGAGGAAAAGNPFGQIGQLAGPLAGINLQQLGQMLQLVQALTQMMQGGALGGGAQAGQAAGGQGGLPGQPQGMAQRNPAFANFLGKGGVSPQAFRQMPQAQRQQLRQLFKQMPQNVVNNALQSGGQATPFANAMGGGQQIQQQNAQTINNYFCCCKNGQGQQTQANQQNDAWKQNEIKGDQKKGYYFKHGQYEKCKDGSMKGKNGDILKPIAGQKGHYAVHKNGAENPTGVYKSPKGEKVASPLTFDLNGNGKAGTTDIANGKKFDIDADGKLDQTAWAEKGDGVLAFDKDGDGVAGKDGSELLGNNTDVDGDGKADGHKNGYDALKSLAVKHLGQESVADGKLDQWELKTLEQKTGLTMQVDGQNKSLAEAGIKELNLGYQDRGQGKATEDENGNEKRQIGSFTRTDGTQGESADNWFKHRASA